MGANIIRRVIGVGATVTAVTMAAPPLPAHAEIVPGGPTSVAGRPWEKEPVTQACLYGAAADGTISSGCARSGLMEFPLLGARVEPRAGHMTFVTTRWVPRMTESAYLYVAPDGRLRSVLARMTPPAGAPQEGQEDWRVASTTTVGTGWGKVRSITVPHDLRSPYTYVLNGSSLRRYTLKLGEKGVTAVIGAPVVAHTGFGSVRDITWIRSTTVEGRKSDVLLAVAGDRLLQYTITRESRPRVRQVVLARTGFRVVDAMAAGREGFESKLSPHGQVVLLRHGRDVAIMLDPDNTDSSLRYAAISVASWRLTWTPR